MNIWINVYTQKKYFMDKHARSQPNSGLSKNQRVPKKWHPPILFCAPNFGRLRLFSVVSAHGRAKLFFILGLPHFLAPT
jgi:hypothetical protein